MEFLEIAQAATLLDAALSHLQAHEAENQLLLSALQALTKSGERGPRYFCLRQGSKILIVGVVVRDELHISMSETENTTALFQHLQNRDLKLTSVNGEKLTAQDFAKTWGEQNPQASMTIELEHDVMIATHDATSNPNSKAHEIPIRLATKNDLNLIAQWSLAFVAECALTESPAQTRNQMRSAIEQRQVFLLHEPTSKAPLSMGLISGPTETFARLSQIYTPPDHRGCGYAEKVVRALLVKIQAQNKTAILHVDPKTPAMKLYARLGFKKNGEWIKIRLAE